MTDYEFLQKAEDFRAAASRARTTVERDWAVYCAGILEEQAVLLEKTGRCPDVPLPNRPNNLG